MRTLRCLYCGHHVRLRKEGKRPQCSACHKRGGLIPEEQYQRGVKVAKSLLKERRRPDVPFARAVADVIEILAGTFPDIALPPKALGQILQDAWRDMEMEQKVEEEVKKAEQGRGSR